MPGLEFPGFHWNPCDRSFATPLQGREQNLSNDENFFPRAEQGKFCQGFFISSAATGHSTQQRDWQKQSRKPLLRQTLRTAGTHPRDNGTRPGGTTTTHC
jgi:hypothetical protein